VCLCVRCLAPWLFSHLPAAPETLACAMQPTPLCAEYVALLLALYVCFCMCLHPRMYVRPPPPPLSPRWRPECVGACAW
jgi:hypothetical protein